ncbi:MAG: hypothetical protein D6696_04370 [Acidobacteria bacterium]|nr:MAG: hypothetical protein D6696_04370 [Acidobacteriota bacterium]
MRRGRSPLLRRRRMLPARPRAARLPGRSEIASPRSRRSRSSMPRLINAAFSRSLRTWLAVMMA